MKGHFILCTLEHCRVAKHGGRPVSKLVTHKWTIDRCWYSPLLCPLSISLSLLSTFCCLFSPFSIFPLVECKTDCWLSPEGGHTVQLTSQAPGTLASPHISPLLHQGHDIWDPALHLKRWASSCVLILYFLPNWWLESLSFRMEADVGETRRSVVC